MTRSAFLANVVDTVQTVDCLNRHVCTEGNPLFGRNPSTEKLVAMKAGFGLLHYLAFAHLRARDPYAARTFARVSVAVQGVVVVANARFAF
jgi:hypothetical protein